MLPRLMFMAMVGLGLIGCDSDSVEDTIDAIDSSINDPERRTIDTSRMGVNAFANDSRFGSIAAQYREVQDVLRLRYVRILFAWSDQVQPAPSEAPNFSFYDDIVAALPEGVEALVVLTNVPAWMSDSTNWINDNPRTTFVERWVRPVVNRYRNNPRITAFQIWNEPNTTIFPENEVLSVTNSPDNYLELLAGAYSVIRDRAPGKAVVMAATTAINQNFPSTINYNKALRDGGAEQFADVWAIHYYGKQYEQVVRSDGIANFLNELERPIWMTESGAEGVDKQLEYVEKTWPFLRERISGIDRIFYYQFTSSRPANETYGLRTLDQNQPVSNLYTWLRDR